MAKRGTCWAYRASDARADKGSSLAILDKHGFLWRKLHNVIGGLIVNVRHVRPGDKIFIWYRSGPRLTYFGAFRVLEPGTSFARRSGCPAAATVRKGSALEKAIDACRNTKGGAAFERDSIENVHTGFKVARIRNAPQPLPPSVGRTSLIPLACP